MLLLLLIFIAVRSQNPCGVERTIEVGFANMPYYTCESLTQAYCELGVYIDNAGDIHRCWWSTLTSTCNLEPGVCKPSCFLRGRIAATNCADGCAGKFTGGFGTSKLCNIKQANGLPTCENDNWCDYSCPGYIKTTTNCAGLDNIQCSAYYYHDSTGDYNCEWNLGTGACAPSQKCIKVCNGVFSTPNCSSLPWTITACGSYYETRTTGNYDCAHNPTTTGCISTYPSGQCYYPGNPACPSTHVDDCATITNRVTCQSLFTVDWTISGGTKRKCKWRTNNGPSPFGVCNPDRPCS